MAETIDLLESLRGTPGIEIEGELTVTLDRGAIGTEVAEALAQQLKANLPHGLAPDGTPLQVTADATEKRWGPGSRGYRSGELAESYTVRATEDGAVIESSLPERATRSLGEADLVTDAALALPEVDEAYSRALRRSMGDE